MQQCLLLQGNLIHSGVTRGEKLVVLIGQRKALAMAVKSNRTENRFPGLLERLIVLEENRRPAAAVLTHAAVGVWPSFSARSAGKLRGKLMRPR
jgi:hypothetical protein